MRSLNNNKINLKLRKKKKIDHSGILASASGLLKVCAFFFFLILVELATFHWEFTYTCMEYCS